MFILITNYKHFSIKKKIPVRFLQHKAPRVTGKFFQNINNKYDFRLTQNLKFEVSYDGFEN